MKVKSKYKPCSAALLPAVAALAFCAHVAQAFEFDTEDSDLKIRWDNTIKYSTIDRLQDPSATQLALYKGSPAGDGDRNFSKGRSEEHTSELQSLTNLVCRLLLEKKKKKDKQTQHTRYTEKRDGQT